MYILIKIYYFNYAYVFQMLALENHNYYLIYLNYLNLHPWYLPKFFFLLKLIRIFKF